MPYLKSQIPNLPRKLRKGREAARAEMLDAVDEYAHDELAEFQGRIEDQRFASFRKILYPESGTNLSPKWLAFKERYDLDMRTMIATGHYLGSIKVFSQAKGKNGRNWRIGFRKDAVARDKDGKSSGITLNLLALVHEHGSVDGNIPPRPHWGPNLNRMKREAPAHRKAIRKRVVAAAEAAMKTA